MKIPEPTLNKLLTAALRRQDTYRSVESEVIIGPGMRADILAVQDDASVVLLELKARPLRQVDVTQVLGYTRCLEEQGYRVLPHLIGDGWPALERPPDVVFLDWALFWKQLA